MSDTVVLVEADEFVAETLAAPLRSRGWEVFVCAPDERDAFDHLLGVRPDAIVFDLASDAPRQRDLASAAMNDPQGFRPITLFLGGDEAERTSVRELVPHGMFVTPDELLWVLKRVATPNWV